MDLRNIFSRGGAVVRAAALLCGCLLAQSAAWAVTLTPATVPSSGVAGANTAFVTGSGFPTGILPGGVTVSFATSCLATSPTTTTLATSARLLLGSTERIGFVIPGSLATGTYSVWVTGSSPAFASTTCSTLNVTNSSSKIEACIPSSSLAVALGKNVDAYVPHGCWECGGTGVGLVPIEGTDTPATIATPGVVNACSSDAITGETVCTANTNDVYLITGSTLNTTLTSGANQSTSFSGGACRNCGVAIDAANNTAYIEEGVAGGSSGEGIQALNLATNAFNAPFPMHFHVSENIAVDPNLNYIFSPGEDSNYTVLQIAPGVPPSGGALTEFGEAIPTDADLDSAAEDCTTGIALSSSEFTSHVIIQDMTQAVFTPGTPGTYTAPEQSVTLTGGFYAAGTSGISIAPGSSHLAVVTGEFGGNTFSVLQLPSTSGTGTPNFVDYANTSIPANPAGAGSPCGSGFSAGLDPHTLTAYTSPNDGKPYALFANSPTPNCLVRVDMQAIMAAPRSGDGHSLAGPPPAAAFTYYNVP